MDNTLLGTSGSISWDGMMDSGDLARMGPYVVYLEAFNLNGNVEKFRNRRAGTRLNRPDRPGQQAGRSPPSKLLVFCPALVRVAVGAFHNFATDMTEQLTRARN